MPIELNNYQSFGGGVTSNPISGSFTVNSGEERALYVCVPGGGVAVTSVTFNGVALTALGSTNNNYDGTQWWGMLMPPVGTFTLTVTLTGNYFGFNAVCLNNVDQTSLDLAPPQVTVVDSATNPNQIAWCGDLPSRNMYVLAFIYGNGTPSFVYDPTFDSDPDFLVRTALVPAFTTSSNVSTNYVSVGGYGRVLANGTFKLSLTHNWSGVPPAHAFGYFFVNETLTPAFSGGQMMII